MTRQILEATRKRMEKCIEGMQHGLAAIRTGHASISILDHIQANYYGTMTPLNQMASLSTPDPAMILIQPWDPSTIASIEKAILASDLGLNPDQRRKGHPSTHPSPDRGETQAAGEDRRAHGRTVPRFRSAGAPRCQRPAEGRSSKIRRSPKTRRRTRSRKYRISPTTSSAKWMRCRRRKKRRSSRSDNRAAKRSRSTSSRSSRDTIHAEQVSCFFAIGVFTAIPARPLWSYHDLQLRAHFPMPDASGFK